VTRGGAEAEHATDIVAKLTLRHPHRAILVNAMPHAPNDQLDAWAQAHCQIPQPGRPRVCGEQITIEARGSAVDRVPNTILPLLVPDVPVMLWWMRGEPFDDPRFARFADMVDRMIVDSATFGQPEASLARMAALLESGIRISDLSWSRLTPWRELTAQFFDTPALAAHLDEIARVAVAYEARPGEAVDRSQALLLVGWLAARWRRSRTRAGRPVPRIIAAACSRDPRPSCRPRRCACRCTATGDRGTPRWCGCCAGSRGRARSGAAR